MQPLNRVFRSFLFAVFCLWFTSTSLMAQVVISEIHYHPVEEESFNADGTPALDLNEDIHEFIELFNSGSTAVSLAGWQVTGGVSYTFPTNTTLAPGGFLVLAKNKTRLAAIPQYQLKEPDLFGPYTGQLSNSGETIRLRNDRDQLVDAVPYSAAFPWAIGADALGADREWTGINELEHQYRGRSLERVSSSHPSNDPANWLASPIPGNPSPGRANTVNRTRPLPVVIRLAVYQNSDEQPLIRRNQAARIDAGFSSTNELGRVELEYFLDDINLANEPVTNVVMSAAGEASNAAFFALLPGFPDRTIVRYRIVATRAGIREVVSPRPDDPFRWHAYFISPVRTSTKPVYDCFISTASLSRLGANISGNPRRITAPDPPGNPRTSWNATEPAIFVHEGVVRDIQMRHHGSRYNRNPGRNSFKWFFPRYNQFLGTDSIFETDKGNDFVVGHGIFINAGLPVSSVRYVDLYLNGNAVMQRLEQGEFNGDMLEQYHQTMQKLNPGADLEPSGEIYKSVGTIDLNGEGPYGRGDGRKLGKTAWTPLQMYEWTYSIQNNGWRGHTHFKEMIDAMWTARGDTPTAPNAAGRVLQLREFFDKYWDIDTTLTYLAVITWACPWDDTTQNHFLWRRANGKWSMLPWDCDAWFGRGDNTPATSSIYIGEVGDRNNNFRGPNFFKDAFFKAYREEYKQRLYILNNTLLHPQNITAMGFNSIRSFADARFNSINQQLGFGTFQRPNQPVAQLPTSGASSVPNAVLQASSYSHTASPPQPHVKTIWEIRRSDGSWLEPVYKTTSTTNLTRLPIPFATLEFGSTYYWRCTYVDAQDHPSLASTESSFTFGSTPSTQTNIVKLVSIDASTQWKYEQSGANLGTAWKEIGFNDSSWASGPALLAVETAAIPEPIRTPLTLGPTTFYFRHRFQYSGPASTVLSLRTVLDDGAVVYLNGREIWRNRVNVTPPLSSTLADANVGDAVYEGPFEISVTNLLQGTNVLAVEVHQSAVNSSDIVFGLSLESRTVTTSGGDVVLNEILADNRGGVTNQHSTPDFIELYNSSDRAVKLDGYSLSDNILNPGRFVFPPGTIIAPRGYLTVWCDSEGTLPGLHTGFGLSASGQMIALYAPSNNGPAVKDSVEFGFQVPDHSIGRTADGNSWRLNRPTPGEPNITQPTSTLDAVRINEWLASPVSGEDWFELFNSSNLPADIGGHYLSSDPAIPLQSLITRNSYVPAGGFVVFVADGEPDRGKDHANFKLSASGDTLALVSSNRVVINSVTFNSQAAGVSQGRLPDGANRLVSFQTTASPGEPNHVPHPAVVINEVLTHSDPPMEDAVELFNLSGSPIDLSGWYLSDDHLNPLKFRFPSGSILPAGGFLVIFENQFNPAPGTQSSFALSSSRGDEVVLSSVDGSGRLDGQQARVAFGAARHGVSFGRHPTSVGADFTALSSTSFGSENATSLEEFRKGVGRPNALPMISPVVISEIMYHPPDLVQGTTTSDNTLHEFIELRNVTGNSIPLYDTAYPSNSWRIRGGVEMDLPPGITLAPGAHLVLVNFDPATNSLASAFRNVYPSTAQTRLVGPYRGKLSNSGDRIDLQMPDQPEPAGSNEPGFVPYVVADRVVYSDFSPWPPTADGGGQSLHRRSDTAYGNDPANWSAAPPTPGSGGSGIPMTDTDGDGIPDNWESANGLDPRNPSDAMTDLDRDGMNNLSEFIAGTDPGNPASLLKLRASREPASGRLILNFQVVAGRSYEIWHKPGVDQTEWTLLTPVIKPAADGVQSYIPANSTQQQGYYQLRVR